MASWGRAEYRAFRDFQRNVQRLSETVNMDAFCKECCKELAARLLALVIPATPVRKYPKKSGKKGGTLKRGWGATAQDAKNYVNSLSVTKSGTTYFIEIRNPVYYASYVENGHVTVNGGYVEPQHFLKMSEEKLKTIAPQVLERKLDAYMREVFNV